MRKGHLPPIKEIRNTKSEEQCFEKIHQNINQIQEDYQASSKVTVELMEEHLIWPSKTQTMIQDFMGNITRDMESISNNLASHTVTLEELLYCRVILIGGHHEASEAYVRDKESQVNKTK
jgi:hypothetical protein